MTSRPPTPDPIKSTPGNRCSNQWGRDCICLPQGECKDQWQGEPTSGWPENRPCPGSSISNLVGCIVRPCLGKMKPAQCLWKEACRSVSTDAESIAELNCPGGKEVVCCEHSWMDHGYS
ncbi:hypothetical protein QBC38DRAFT_420753 [Podospora fimiseda]|uniref:Uncharacterized protein n=1 Tax=Podospora fimiseda TaxID=252190 RepID=A0AAN7BLW3_9PEZI|nr:hypothetical protein QBC38DRAFT_420753 [Podospora fimiseda]